MSFDHYPKHNGIYLALNSVMILAKMLKLQDAWTGRSAKNWLQPNKTLSNRSVHDPKTDRTPYFKWSRVIKGALSFQIWCFFLDLRIFVNMVTSMILTMPFTMNQRDCTVWDLQDWTPDSSLSLSLRVGLLISLAYCRSMITWLSAS